MIDDLLDNNLVKEFICDIKNSEKYFMKKIDNIYKYQYDVSKEIILFTFYEALFKYKIIIDEDKYLYDYLNDLDRLFKKIINYHDIVDGVNKLICKVVANKLCIACMTTPDARIEIISYIFDKYYVNGYLYHGFSTVYEDDLINKDFVSGVYNNRYNKMIEINNIYKKYNDVAFNKDFNNNQVFFTDNFVDACYYSLYSPKYLYKFLFDEHDKGNNKCYLDDKFDVCITNVKKSLDRKFEDSEVKKILSNLKEEWEFLNSKERRVSLIVAKRSLIENIDYKRLDVYLESDENLYELADRILCSTNKNISFSNILDKDDYEIFSLDYKDKVVKENMVVEEVKEIEEEKVSVTQDISGSVTVFMLLGSLFISLGVIITVVMLLGGN